jgi:hypothetical protein
MMGLLLARMVVSVPLFCLPIILFAVLSGKPDNMMFVLFPVFGAIPAIIAALVLFVPLESVLDARGMPQYKNVLVPVAGASVVFIFTLVTGLAAGSLGTMITRLSTGGSAAWGAYVLWSVLGAVWGLVWRSTEWLAKVVGLANG